MCELPMCSTAIGTNESPEICADILWSQVVAVDAALVGGQLEQAPYDPLVPLVLLDPAPHRRRIAPRLQTLRTAAPSLLSSSVRAASEREIPRARGRGEATRWWWWWQRRAKGSPLLLLLVCFAARA